ncbi:MAG: hypothetical protein COT45_05950 [bacterium (Candidatus Stahlbacteria) CG08_land_8_20_14_0_20_40_26]|nr:MAG: hypothetical protein COX49_09565 [bacterium (Candidatus Stahlbacteria) CG23_combo_of_CG06-09_8_20_14_all_40_9]PIS23575.1 MAG: hypothetical protein COT45_05950 [bacterium (Candidatus Stahlbacteria) CG08_land_8_20_14_0_20_40_26]
MKRQVPLIITFIVGVVMVIQYFIPRQPFAGLFDTFNRWFLVIAVFALLLGLLNLLRLHVNKVKKIDKGWGYSVVLLSGLVATIFTGAKWGIGTGTPFNYIFVNIQQPMGATMFALLAFFIASASFRAFRARNIDATLLLVAAIIVMLGRVPIGNILWNKLPLIADWIMTYPNTAGQRAIMIGIALGTVSYSLRVILGIERTYLGGE